MWWTFKSRTNEAEPSVEDEMSESSELHPAAQRILQLQRASGNQAVQALLADQQQYSQPQFQEHQADDSGLTETAIDEVVAEDSSSGQKLDPQTRTMMETRFGKDLSQVRIHDDSNAAESAETLNARAYTRGRDIYFASGKYTPATDDGQQLLAHELTHVLQQTELSAPSKRLSERTDASEREADNISTQFRAGRETTLKPTQASAAAIQRDEWYEEEIEHKKERVIYCRPVGRYHTLQQLLRRVEISIYPNPSPKKPPEKGKLPETMKKAPGAQETESYVDARLAFSQWTSKDVKTKINKIFRTGRATFVTEEMVNEVRKIVEEERKKMPDVFSMVQGIETAVCDPAPESSPTCIGTMNFAVQKLFGSRVITTKEMGPKGTVLEAIDVLRDKSLTSDEENFKATYAGSDKRFQILKKSDVKFSGAGNWLKKTAKDDGEGMHVFVFSVANGFHSVTIMVLHRDDDGTTITWKDQYTVKTLTSAEFDEKVRDYCVARFRFWVRDAFNKKFGTDHDSYDDIKDDPRTPEVENEVKATVLNDISKNLIVKLKPPKTK